MTVSVTITTVEEAIAHRADLRRRKRDLDGLLATIQVELRWLDGYIARNQERVCVHCSSGPADYADGFNGVAAVRTCDGFHCFDCARVKHGLVYAGGPRRNTDKDTDGNEVAPEATS